MSEPDAATLCAALVCGNPRCQCAATARRGSGLAHCPGHTDSEPSLAVTLKGGKVLVHCQAGCDQKAVIAALRERGLWPEAKRRSNRRIVATYPYVDEAGLLLFEAVRYEPKDFRQRRPDGNGGFVDNIEGVRRVLYRLPQLVAADPTELVYIVEGERHVDRLIGLGFISTTSPMGAGKWRAEYNDSLAGRKAVVLPDNDGPGRAHAQEVVASLHGVVLLGDVAALIRRFVVLSPEQASATALWVVHTYAIDAADASPYLHITSPEKRSGKTRLLEVLDLLAARPWFTGRVTAAVLQRRLEWDHPALLLDETDAAFKKESEYSEALRAILNSGHRRGCPAWLCVGKGHELASFDVFGPKALAGIGKLPETIVDRCIRLVLRRRAPNETVARFRRREVEEEAGFPTRKSRTMGYGQRRGAAGLASPHPRLHR